MAVSNKQRAIFKREGVSQPSGSYPIPNRAYLKKAIHAFGRSSTPAATKAHIIDAAHKLGAADELPADWPGSKKGAAQRMAKSRGM